MSITRLVTNLLPINRIDKVAIYNDQYQQIFTDARPLKVSVKENSKVMAHPVESGATTIDHRIVLPVEIEISYIISSQFYQDIYKEIRSYYLNGTLLYVQTRSGLYENQLITSIPHEEDADQYDSLVLSMKLQQVLVVRPQYQVISSSNRNATRVNRGMQTGQPATVQQQTTTAQNIAGFLSHPIQSSKNLLGTR